MTTPIAYGSGRKSRRIVSGRASASGRPLGRATFWTAVLVLFIGFVLAGAWLVDGVAAIGRGDNDCLHSARQICGVFKSW
jgi:hypothetical protein